MSERERFEALQESRDRAVRLLHMAMAQLRRWGDAYGTHTPPWLPPAGYVRLAEDVDEFTAALARSQQTASGSVVEARSNEQGPPHESI